MENPQQKDKRERGRPKGKTGLSRETILRVRMSDDEHAIAAAKARARGLTLSSWVRDTLSSAPR